MLLPLLDLAIVFHCVVFGIFFLVKKGGIGRTHFYLGVLLFLLAIMSLPYGLKPTGWLTYFPYLTDMEWPAGFLFAPFYWWYVREMIGEKVVFRWKEGVLVLPAFAALCFFGRFYLKSTEDQSAYVQLILTTYLPAYEIGDAIFYAYIQGYFIYILAFLYKKSKRVAPTYVSNVNWLWKYTLFLLGFGFFGLLAFLCKWPQAYIDTIPVASAIIYMTLIYKSFQSQAPSPSEEKIEEEVKADERHLKIAQSLTHYLQVEKKYRNSELTLASLCQEVGEPTYLVSQTIKLCFQSKFVDLISEYRVKEAQERLKNMTAHETVEGIAYEAGFSSRAAFYRAYKRYTGENPSDTVQWNIAEK